MNLSHSYVAVKSFLLGYLKSIGHGHAIDGLSDLLLNDVLLLVAARSGENHGENENNSTKNLLHCLSF